MRGIMKKFTLFSDKNRKKSFIQAGLYGGLVVFIWGMFSWMVLPWHHKTMHTFKDERKVATVIRDNVTEDGIYAFPSATVKKEKNEPFIVASVRVEGMRCGVACSVVISALIQIVAAFLIAYLLSKTKYTDYMHRVGFVTTIGLLIAILAYLPAWNWWDFPASYTIVNFVDTIIAWFLGGLVIAKFVKKSLFE